MGVVFTVRVAAGEPSVKIIVPTYPDNLQAAVERFGEEKLYKAVRQSHVIAMQAIARRLLRGGATPEVVSEYLSKWQPGARVGRGKDKKISLTEVTSLVREKLRAKGATLRLSTLASFPLRDSSSLSYLLDKIIQ